MLRISAVYPNNPGSQFDSGYYVSQHTPFAERLLSPHGLDGIRTTLGMTGMDDAPPPYWAISEMVFTSRSHFDAAMAQCGEKLFADIPNYTDVTPVLQISSLCGDANEAKGS